MTAGQSRAVGFPPRRTNLACLKNTASVFNTPSVAAAEGLSRGRRFRFVRILSEHSESYVDPLAALVAPFDGVQDALDLESVPESTLRLEPSRSRRAIVSPSLSRMAFSRPRTRSL